MAAWAAFGALTLVLIAILLLLSMVSASAIDASEPIAERSTAPERRQTGERGVPGANPSTDRRLPRFEPPSGAEGSEGSKAFEDSDASRDSETGWSPDASGDEDSPPAMSTGALLVNVAFTQGLFGLALLAGAVYFEIPLSAFGLGSPPVTTGILLAGIGVGVALWIGNELGAGVADAANVAYDEAVRSMLTPDSIGGWVLLLGVILPTIAFVEELLFRGAAIGALAAGFELSEPLLLVLSSLAFGGAHGAQGRVGAVVATILGFVLGGVFVVTGSLLVVVIAHYLVNSLEFVVHEGLDVDRPLTVTSRRGRR